MSTQDTAEQQAMRMNMPRKPTSGDRPYRDTQTNNSYLCTGAFLYAPYSFLLISYKFWMGGGGGQCGYVT